MVPDGRPVVAVTAIGRVARRVLAAPAGRVAAVFRRGFYVEGADGLACVGARELGLGPLIAVAAVPDGADWRAEGVDEGAAVESVPGGFRVAGRLAFDLDRARDWRAPRLPSWRAADLAANLAVLTGLVAAILPAEGLGFLAAVPARAADPGVDPFRRAAVPAARALDAWLADPAAAFPPDAAEGLIGLGPGLTPAGDDYIGGALIALAAFGRRETADRLAAWGVPLARVLTGPVSAAHVAAAADGEGAEALHETLLALATPGAPDLGACLEVLAAIGHTSGWDALAGAVAVCRAVVER